MLLLLPPLLPPKLLKLKRPSLPRKPKNPRKPRKLKPRKLTLLWKLLLLPSNTGARNEKGGGNPAFFYGHPNAHPHRLRVTDACRPACSGSPESSSCGTTSGHRTTRYATIRRGARAPCPMRDRGIIARRPCVIILVIPVRNPLPRVAVHVVKAQRVRRETAHRGRKLKAITPRKRIAFPLRPAHHRIGGEGIRGLQQGSGSSPLW